MLRGVCRVEARGAVDAVLDGDGRLTVAPGRQQAFARFDDHCLCVCTKGARGVGRGAACLEIGPSGLVVDPATADVDRVLVVDSARLAVHAGSLAGTRGLLRATAGDEARLLLVADGTSTIDVNLCATGNARAWLSGGFRKLCISAHHRASVRGDHDAGPAAWCTKVVALACDHARISSIGATTAAVLSAHEFASVFALGAAPPDAVRECASHEGQAMYHRCARS